MQATILTEPAITDMHDLPACRKQLSAELAALGLDQTDMLTLSSCFARTLETAALVAQSLGRQPKAGSIQVWLEWAAKGGRSKHVLGIQQLLHAASVAQSLGRQEGAESIQVRQGENQKVDMTYA